MGLVATLTRKFNMREKQQLIAGFFLDVSFRVAKVE